MEDLTPEQRDWNEYLHWTRNASPDQYRETEERAWQRLQSAALRRRIAPYAEAWPHGFAPERDELLLPQGEEGDDLSRPEGGSDVSL